MSYLISEDGAAFTEVTVMGPGEQAGTTAFKFAETEPHVYTAPAWRLGTDKAELRRQFALRRCDALERMAVDLQRQSTVLMQHAVDLRRFLEGQA
jgi:hypothetical protein